MRKSQLLTVEQAAEIRRRYTDGGVTQGQLAISFGVSSSMISMIIGGKRYAGGPGRIYTRQADPEDRVCRICHERKLIAEFSLVVWKHSPQRKGKYGWRETRCRNCAGQKHRETLATNDADRTHRRRNYRTARHKVRAEVLEHYGDRCFCCGETRNEFLGIDHINGGGKQHRKITGGGGRFYRWIIKHGFPTDLRLACWNCNLARGFRGYCPHELNPAC